jgi:hypothetical protein
VLQAVKQLGEAIAELPEDSCADLLILPLYAAMPLELQVSRSQYTKAQKCHACADVARMNRSLQDISQIVC